VLDGIKGVGPATKRALVKHFGTIKAIREASVEQLCAVEGVGIKLAEKIRAGIKSERSAARPDG
jgi:excinuclease ABC subunit C